MDKITINEIPYLGCYGDCGSLPIRALIIAGGMVQFTQFREVGEKMSKSIFFEVFFV